MTFDGMNDEFKRSEPAALPPDDGSGRRQHRRRVALAGIALVVGLIALTILGQGYREKRLNAFLEAGRAPKPGMPASSSGRLALAANEYKDALRSVQQAQLSNSLAFEKGESEDSSPAGGAAEVSSAPMIARTASIEIAVKDFVQARAAVEAILARHHGYAAQLTISTEQGAPRSLQGSLRIPAGELNAAMAELKALGTVLTEQQGGEEVTQQHADLMARLKNGRETETRLQAILRDRTGKIADVLAAEQEIARVRGEIEQMESEQKMLEHRVDFATVDLKVGEEYRATLSTMSPSVWTQLRNATVTGFRSAWTTILGIVLFVIEVGPSLVIWVAALGIPIWFVWKRRRSWFGWMRLGKAV